MATVTETGNARNTVVPNYVTESGYTEDISGRSNVGDTQSTTRLAAIGVETGEVKWVDHGQQKRDVQLGLPVWSEDGTKAVIVGRAADNKDRWIFALDPATGKTRVLANQHDDAWVDGPGANTIGWMKNDREVYFQSEKTGYSHLYAVAWDGGEPRALTSGNWEVLNVRQSKDKSHFYLTASKDSPYEQHLYEMDGDGGPLTRLTKEPGRHATTVSPDERWIADIYSYTNKPPELYVEENRPLAEGEETDHLARPRVLSVSVAGCSHRDLHRAGWSPGAGAPVQTRRLQEGRAGGGLRSRFGLFAERGPQVVHRTTTSTCSITS